MAAVAACSALALIGAVRAVQPGGIAAAEPGMWEVSRSATGANPVRLCLADPKNRDFSNAAWQLLTAAFAPQPAATTTAAR